MATFELTPNDSHKSFYGKAHVVEIDNACFLRSYDTIVCKYDRETGEFSRMWCGYSATTMRHVRAFIAHYGLDLPGTAAWWRSLEIA